MPTYEYRCKGCGATFTCEMSMREHERLSSLLVMSPTLATYASTDADVVRCPRCNDIRVEQQLSPFCAKTTRKW